jgi:hypothetical protein
MLEAFVKIYLLPPQRYFCKKKKLQLSWLTGGVKKKFPRFTSLLEPQFPLGNPLFHPPPSGQPGAISLKC